MSDLTQRLREHAALHGEIAKFSDEQAQWARDLLAAANYIDNDEVKGIHSCHDNCQRLECVQRREIERLRRELAEARKAREDAEQLMRDGWIEVADGPASKVYRKQRDEAREKLAEARGLLVEARGPVDHAARWAFGHLKTEVAEDLFELLTRIDAFLAKHKEQP